MTQPHRTARNVFLVSAASLAQIVVQFLFQRVLAKTFGAAEASDALFAALVLPTMFAAIVTGSIGYVLIPELVARFKQGEKVAEAWQLASFVGLAMVAASTGFAAWLFWGASGISSWLYQEMDAAQQSLTGDLLKIVSIQVVLLGIISWAQAIYHSRHQFLLPALSGVVGTGVTLFLAYRYGGSGVTTIAWAINGGSVVSGLMHVVPLVSKLGFPQANTEHLWKLIRVFWPLLLGAAFLRVDPLIDRVLADRIGDEGAISHVNFAHRFLTALLAIGTSSLAVVAFPQLAERLTTGGTRGLAEHFSLAFRRLLLLVIPMAIGVGTFSVWIVRDLLEGGLFTEEDSRVVGYLIACFMGLFVGASSGELFARAFFVLGDTKTPTAIGVVSLVLGLCMKVMLFQMLGIWGIALGVSIYFMGSSSCMAVFLARRITGSAFAGSGRIVCQATASSVVACGFCYLIYANNLGSTWVAAPTGAIVYFVCLLMLRNRDARQLLEVIHRRLVGRP